MVQLDFSLHDLSEPHYKDRRSFTWDSKRGFDSILELFCRWHRSTHSLRIVVIAVVQVTPMFRHRMLAGDQHHEVLVAQKLPINQMQGTPVFENFQDDPPVFGHGVPLGGPLCHNDASQVVSTSSASMAQSSSIVTNGCQNNVCVVPKIAAGILQSKSFFPNSSQDNLFVIPTSSTGMSQGVRLHGHGNQNDLWVVPQIVAG
mmetsp:Transcript_32774/g.70405  ORF Transcript_32774/g.70405 Transcript_32774/m.70405 type:complete len:202 (+) Transcript_32774:443-1048(+)